MGSCGELGDVGDYEIDNKTRGWMDELVDTYHGIGSITLSLSIVTLYLKQCDGYRI